MTARGPGSTSNSTATAPRRSARTDSGGRTDPDATGATTGEARHWYAALGLTVASDLPLPELRAITPPGAGEDLEEADVRFRLGIVDDSEPGDGRLRRTDDGDVLEFSDCRLLVRDGREIVVQPHPDGTDAGVRWCLLGAGVNFLLAQRGALVIHASVVGVDGRAVAFVGPSGRGKSTTAAAFLAAGHDLLADDVAAIQVVDGSVGSRALVVPGFAAVKLTPEAVASLGVAVELAGDSPIPDKQFYRTIVAAEGIADGVADDAVTGVEADADRVAARDPTEPLPLAAIYLLEEGESIGTEPVPPGAAVAELMYESHTVATHREAVAAGSALARAGAVAGAVPVRRLTRPLSFDALPAVVALVEREVAGSEVRTGDAASNSIDASERPEDRQ